MRWLALCVAVALGAGCGGHLGEIVADPHDLSEASGSPSIDEIVELGGGDVLLTAPLAPARQPDGLAVVGEALWVRGSAFGRQPTVTIAGQPAGVLARTTDGGLVVRVPPGTAAGRQPLRVVTGTGATDAPIELRRFALGVLPGAGSLVFADVSASGFGAPGAVAAMAGALRVSPDGRAAYVADLAQELARARLEVFEVPAQGGPRRVESLDLWSDGKAEPGTRLVAFCAASRASVLAFVVAGDRAAKRPGSVIVFDVGSPLRPQRRARQVLPAALAGQRIVAAALAPNGRTLALALADDNRVVLLDIGGDGPAQGPLASIAVAPAARVPVIADLAFAPDGKTLWIAEGDTTDSASVGPQPTALVAVRVDASALTASGAGPASSSGSELSVSRRVLLPGISAPTHVSTGRVRPLASGASIRLPPERATVYLSGSTADGQAVLLRLGAEDNAQPLWKGEGTAGDTDLTPSGRYLLAPIVGAAGTFSAVAVPADDHPGQTQTVDLRLRVPAGTAKAAGAAARVVAQP